MGKSAMLGSLEDTLEMSGAIDGVQPCLDFAHLHARPGDGTMNTFDEWCALLQAYSNTLGKTGLRGCIYIFRVLHMVQKVRRRIFKLAEADLDLKSLLRALQEFGCGGRILCESPIMEDDALNMKRAWGKISGEKG